jgi:hypothetical protein
MNYYMFSNTYSWTHNQNLHYFISTDVDYFDKEMFTDDYIGFNFML